MNDTQVLQLCYLLGISPEERSKFMFELGFQYLELKMDSKQWVKAISRTKSFWSWYKNQFNLEDRRILHLFQCCSELPEQEKLMKTWLAAHTPSKLPDVMGHEVYKDAYKGWKQMMGSAIKEVVK